MSYKYLFVGVGVGALVVGLIIFGLLTSANSESKELNTSIAPITKADKVEVFLFHATQRCTTCIAIGRLAGETVNEYFQVVQKIEKTMRYGVASVFILTGIYYTRYLVIFLAGLTQH